MGYYEFPPNLTEEELRLQVLYNKLKAKKKALQDLKTPKPEPEPEPAPRASKQDARKMAKKLLQSGAISKSPNRWEKSFKRPVVLERKLNSADSSEKVVPAYQSFSMSQLAEEPESKRQKVAHLRENFVAASSTNPEDKTEAKTNTTEPPTELPAEPPAKGNTIFVSGYRICEDFLREHFAMFGTIVEITIRNKKKGFITFDNPKSAEDATKSMNGMLASSIQLEVTMARRQFEVEPPKKPTPSKEWSSVAARYERRVTHKDKRDLTDYKENFFSD